jgi:hypothetical protein
MKRMAMVTCLQPENPNSQTNTKYLPASTMLNFSLLTIQVPTDTEVLKT